MRRAKPEAVMTEGTEFVAEDAIEDNRMDPTLTVTTEDGQSLVASVVTDRVLPFTFDVQDQDDRIELRLSGREATRLCQFLRHWIQERKLK
jgi:hypothetical protein